MCGPVQCLPCQPDFLRRLKTDRQVQVWTLLWIPLVVLWVIYFGFQIDNLASAVEDKSFQVMLKKQETIALPAWTICSDNSSTIVQVQCQMDGGPLLVQKKYYDGCFGFNDKPPLLKATAGKGNIDCVIGFQSASQSAKAFLHDPIYTADIHDRLSGQTIYDFLKRVPSGICVADIQEAAQTFFWWRWNRFEFMNGDRVNGYSPVSSSIIQNHASPAYNFSAGMRMEVGDYYQWRYYEVQWWSGYDFWYFMGMVGGASFLLLLVHAIFFYPLKHLYAAAPGYTNVDEEEAVAGRPMRDIGGSRDAASSSSSSGGNYDTL